MKVVIDTNVIVSAVLRDRNPEKAILYVVDRPEIFDWVVSVAILAEYKQVLSRSKFKAIDNVRSHWLNLIDEAVKIIDVSTSFDFPRDPKDAKFLECAIAANADYLVTGDRDFDEISDLQNTQVVSVSSFLEIVELN
jgi:putative PIN family toxin of toxin-antitoxin system